MIRSMTGYGKASKEIGNKKVTVEMKSLNSKGLDVMIKTNSLYREKELELRSWLSSNVSRGKVDLAIYAESGEEEKRTVINKELAKSYFAELNAVASEIGNFPEDYLSLIMRMPDILKTDRPELVPEEWDLILEIIADAFSAYEEFRLKEGQNLEKDLLYRVAEIRRLKTDIAEIAHERTDKKREKLTQALREVEDNGALDENRLEQELIYYLEKFDITEEQVRLDSHLNYFLEILADESEQGRKLGFVCQEIGREINTIGSKANHAEIQKMVVQMKDELEKMKEQVLNVL
jgi:uncharacterized protein (TIGR00255 family)